MQIKDYMPKLYNNNVEMNAMLTSEQNDFENHIKTDINNSFKNTFIQLANIEGVKAYEQILNIKSSIDESIEFRKERIINRLTTTIPFTETFLKNRLNEIFGSGNWTYTISYATYSLTITTLAPGASWYAELIDFLNKILPCNLSWTLVLYAVKWQAISDNFNTWQDVYDEEMTWQEITNGEWI